MLSYLNHSKRVNKINSISFALSFTQEFSLAILSQSQLFTDIFKEQLLFFIIKIVQGVCSCFSLFNLQGTPLSLADSSHIISRLPTFVKHFFKFFWVFLNFICCTVFAQHFNQMPVASDVFHCFKYTKRTDHIFYVRLISRLSFYRKTKYLYINSGRAMTRPWACQKSP